MDEDDYSVRYAVSGLMDEMYSQCEEIMKDFREETKVLQALLEGDSAREGLVDKEELTVEDIHSLLNFFKTIREKGLTPSMHPSHTEALFSSVDDSHIDVEISPYCYDEMQKAFDEIYVLVFEKLKHKIQTDKLANSFFIAEMIEELSLTKSVETLLSEHVKGENVFKNYPLVVFVRGYWTINNYGISQPYFSLNFKDEVFTLPNNSTLSITSLKEFKNNYQNISYAILPNGWDSVLLENLNGIYSKEGNGLSLPEALEVAINL